MSLWFQMMFGGVKVAHPMSVAGIDTVEIPKDEDQSRIQSAASCTDTVACPCGGEDASCSACGGTAIRHGSAEGDES